MRTEPLEDERGEEADLTGDEVELLQLLAAGVKDEVAVVRLGLSRRTVRRRLRRAMTKLRAGSRFQGGYRFAMWEAERDPDPS